MPRTASETRHGSSLRHDIFIDYSLSNQDRHVFGEAEDLTRNLDGWILVKGYAKKTVYCYADLLPGCTGVNFSIEGVFKKGDTPSEIYTFDFTSESRAEPIPITEEVNWLRVGAKMKDAITPAVITVKVAAQKRG